MKRLHLLVIVAAALTAASCGKRYAYESVHGDPLGTRIYTLDNGLKIYTAVNRDAPRVSAFVAVRTGGKNDPAETTGLSHYLEHLLFKGTDKFGTQDYAAEKPMLDTIEQLYEVYRLTTDEDARRAIYRRIDSVSLEASKLAIPNEYDKLMAAIGSEGSNAFTGYDETVYTESVPSNQLENWAKIQYERFSNPVLRGFHTELEAVYEEKNISLSEDMGKMYDSLMSGLFRRHPYGLQTVIGTQEDLKNPSITNIKNHFAKWYVPNNMAIILTGDFDPDKTVAMLDRYFGQLVPSETQPAMEYEPEEPITEPVVKEAFGNDMEMVAIGWRTGGGRTPDADMTPLVQEMLYNGTAGLLDLDINQQQKALQALASGETLSDYGIVFVVGIPKSGQTLEDLGELLLSEVDKLRSGQFDDDLITAAAANYKANNIRSMESPYDRAYDMTQVFISGADWKNYVERPARMAATTKEEVMAFAADRMGPDNYVIVYKRMGKDPNIKSITKPEITPIASNRNVSSPFLLDIQASEVKPIEPAFVDFERDLQQTEVRKGLPLIYSHNGSNDLFTVIFVFETGYGTDPALSTATDYIQYLGTSDMTPDQISREFYKLACEVSYRVGRDRTTVTLSGLSENMGKALELYSNLINGAVPDEDALEGLKDDILKSREDAKLSQQENFSRLVSYGTYGPQNPYNYSLSDGEIAALTSDELLGRLRRLVGSEQRILYYGPETSKQVAEELRKSYDVPDELTPLPGIKPYPEAVNDGNRVILAQYDAEQLLCNRISNLGGTYSLDDVPGIELFNEYFGNGMGSIVFQEMRETRGLAYTAGASIRKPARTERPYMFTAFIGTQYDKMGEALDAYEEIIEEMPRSESSFVLAKDALVQRLRTERTTGRNVLDSWLRAQDLGLDHDYRQDVYEKVQDMTLDDVMAVHDRWIAGRPYTYCILGPISDLDMDRLMEIGPVSIVTQKELFGY